MAELRQLSVSQQIDLLLADLSTRQGFGSLAEQFDYRYECLDVLINNAGLAESKRHLRVDGIEADFALNVLAPSC